MSRADAAHEARSPGIPERASEIDARWLEAALAPRYAGVKVASVETREQVGGTHAHARLRVTYQESGGAPEALFCKLLPQDEPRRQAIAATAMGVREARFLEHIAPSLSLRVPAAHVVAFDEDDGRFVLLVEDLIDSGCALFDGTRGVTPDAAARALEELAAMHVRFEDATIRRSEASWVPEPGPPSDYGLVRLREALANHRHRLSPAFATMAELYVSQPARLHVLWHEGPQTLIHGDLHLGNLFDDHGRTGFLDWGLVLRSMPLRDLCYFLQLSLGVEDRRSEERFLIRHYLEVRRALGGEPFSFEMAWQRHRLLASYLAPACCQIVTFPEDATPERKIFAEAFLARAEAAIEDLESREALRRFAGIA